MSKILDGKAVCEEIKKNLKDSIKGYMIKPCLAIIQIGDNEESNIYIKNKEKACNDVGIYFKHIKYEEKTKEIEIINKIIELNNDDYVNGILLQLPVSDKYNKNRLISYISSKKDIDGLTDISLGKLFHNKKGFIPCTALGIITLLEHYKIDVEDKNVVIVGRSNLVGKPLMALLLNKNANVSICHSKTTNLKEHTKEADILISATGVPNLIKKDMIKEGAIVIDVGITKQDGKILGDVDFKEVKTKASYITPVPGGVGPMTIACLLQNVNEAYKSTNTSI